MGVSRGRRYRRSPPHFWTKIIFWNINYNWVYFKLTSISKLYEFALSVLISYWFSAWFSTKFSGGCAPGPLLLLPLLAVRCSLLTAFGSKLALHASPFRKSWIRPWYRLPEFTPVGNLNENQTFVSNNFNSSITLNMAKFMIVIINFFQALEHCIGYNNYHFPVWCCYHLFWYVKYY